MFKDFDIIVAHKVGKSVVGQPGKALRLIARGRIPPVQDHAIAEPEAVIEGVEQYLVAVALALKNIVDVIGRLLCGLFVAWTFGLELNHAVAVGEYPHETGLDPGNCVLHVIRNDARLAALGGHVLHLAIAVRKRLIAQRGQFRLFIGNGIGNLAVEQARKLLL
jgi:hypothetical protein